MLIGSRHSFMSKISDGNDINGFLNPDKLTSYIRRLNSSDDCCIKIECNQLVQHGTSPFTLQFIIQILSDQNTDKKFLKLDGSPDNWKDMGIIGGSYRFGLYGDDEIGYSFAGGNYDGNNGRQIATNLSKMNAIFNAQTGQVTFNEVNILDMGIPTSVLPIQKYYLIGYLNKQWTPTYLYPFGFISHDWET